MIQSRRKFIGAAAFAMAASAWGCEFLAAQNRGNLPMHLPDGPFPNDPFGDSVAPERRLSPATQLKMNQEQIQKDMMRLKAAVDELQKEFDSNNTTAVLSMGAVHKAEEIERLARQIKELVHG